MCVRHVGINKDGVMQLGLRRAAMDHRHGCDRSLGGAWPSRGDDGGCAGVGEIGTQIETFLIKRGTTHRGEAGPS